MSKRFAPKVGLAFAKPFSTYASVKILPESATPEEITTTVPVGTHAFAFGRNRRSDLGIRLITHECSGPQLSNIYQTGPEASLRLFARLMTARHPRERWAFEDPT